MTNPDTPLAVAKEVFNARPPDSGPVYGGTALADGSYVLFRLKDVRPGAAEDADESTVQQIGNSLAARRGAGYFASYQGGLRGSAKVEIFEENL
jgi:hypothetical protein